MESKRLMIFGCGYVGRSLAKATAEAGWEVWIHSRNAKSLAEVNEIPTERRIIGNLHEDEWQSRLKGQWDAVVNLVSSAGGGLEGYKLSYLEGNRSIRAWAEEAAVRRFIYSSATSVYPQTEGEWVSEDDVPEMNHLSPSGAVLREAELEILQSDIFPERVVARLAGIYGPGRHLYLNRLQEGAQSLPGDGSAWLNLIYLKDIVTALIQLLDAPMPNVAEVFNVVDDEPARKQEIVDWLATKLGLPTIPFNPDDLGPRASRRTTQGGLPNRRVSNAKLKESIGWKPSHPSFREGYADILKGR
ncbi:NAD-dependent epimerase/dehydratase family protein [Puniceicoccales bacterium CK1056]|uniref:NAD-dependent epimerase/dehydratase family protein n=1 Tax=Oceanipulchritudo coccoides TaxID=2706888 RepID=A0A6B2M077_9BACT|nr:NAD-dependent epimerase/dehydratase family protein [Oceanipulchritudo coccoides]NDV61746.1 NAD-dependent epimerase/dehydratase family protein [Oceanipulchritudo coccoides]